MSSGAFALYIDATAGSGGNPVHRVIPLPVSGGDGIRFSHRQVSLVYDDFTGTGPVVAVKVRTLKENVLDTAFTMQVHVGCQVVQPIHDDDCAVSFELTLPPGTSLTALVEYSS